MKTLEQLIAEGLPVGALAIHETGAFIQLHLNNIFFIPVMDEYLSVNSYFYTSDKWQPTTAHDSDIDPVTLPIPEPFWTGWVVHRLGINERYQFEELSGNQVRIFTGGWPKEYLKSDCQPCLPPK